jgi:hypothetical protein
MPSLSIILESSEVSIDFSREVISGMIESRSSEFANFNALVISLVDLFRKFSNSATALNVSSFCFLT